MLNGVLQPLDESQQIEKEFFIIKAKLTVILNPICLQLKKKTLKGTSIIFAFKIDMFVSNKLNLKSTTYK